jgi:hypothetical protein
MKRQLATLALLGVIAASTGLLTADPVRKQASTPKVETQLINNDPEPDLEAEGFASLLLTPG